MNSPKNTKPLEWYVNSNGCHIVTSHKISIHGYAEFRRDGVSQRIHRWSYEQCYEKIPKGMVIMHTCDEPSCINIDHLSLGTFYDNTQDMIKKERSRWQTMDKIDGTHIRELRISKGIKAKWLAEKVGITYPSLWRIETGERSVSKEVYDKIMSILK